MMTWNGGKPSLYDQQNKKQFYHHHWKSYNSTPHQCVLSLTAVLYQNDSPIPGTKQTMMITHLVKVQVVQTCKNSFFIYSECI